MYYRNANRLTIFQSSMLLKVSVHLPYKINLFIKINKYIYIMCNVVKLAEQACNRIVANCKIRISQLHRHLSN